LDTHEETSYSQLTDVLRPDKEEKEQQKGKFISCPELVSEKPLSKVNQPASTSNPPKLSREI
jgi:hypothetical protein